MMTLDQLRIFIAVAEREHLTKAAHSLSLTPSAVSSAVRNLEDYYHVALFYRIGRQIVLSDAGKIFLEEARDTLARARMAETKLYELGDMKRGALRIFASQTTATYWLPSYLANFRDRYPLVTLDLVITNSHHVQQAIDEGVADMGFVEGMVEEYRGHLQVVVQDELVVVAAPSHFLATKKNVGFDDLLQATWIVREEGSGTRAVFEKKMHDDGFCAEELKIVLTLPSNEAVLSAISAGPHIGAVSARAAQHYVSAGELVIVNFPRIQRDFLLLTHEKRSLSKIAQSFIATLQAE